MEHEVLATETVHPRATPGDIDAAQLGKTRTDASSRSSGSPPQSIDHHTGRPQSTHHEGGTEQHSDHAFEMSARKPCEADQPD